MIDEIDKKILHELVKDGRSSVEAVAEKVGLSATPVRRRIRRLEQDGIVRAYRADIDLEKCGLELALYVFIKLQSRDRKSIAEFERLITSLKEVQSCDLVTGPFDYILTVRSPSMKAYNDYLRSVLAELPGIFGIETSVVIGQVKQPMAVP